MEETEICDRIAIIDNGKIVALDTPDNLKKTIGGDIITITSEDNARLKAYIEKITGNKINDEKGEDVKFEINDSSSFIPGFIKSSPVKILSISSRKPTLNDVFLELTGHEIREEEVNSMDAMRARMKMRR